VEDYKPAAIPFGRAAYKKPALENTQVVAAVAVNAKPAADGEKKPTVRNSGLHRFLDKVSVVTKFILCRSRQFRLHCTQEEKDKAVFKWAEYAHLTLA
jgi:hypothetical protein